VAEIRPLISDRASSSAAAQLYERKEREAAFSCPHHCAVPILDRLGVRRDLVLVHHVSPPIILPGERLATLPGIRATVLGAVELAGLFVLVVDMAVQMGLRAKLHSASRMGALVRPVMVALVMIELMNLVKGTMTLITGEPW